MQTIDFGLDLISLVAALFAVILSIYNWLMMRRPAKIFPNEIVNYGMIYSEEHEGAKLILPIIFHNEGAKKGLITRIKVGFKHGESVKYLVFVGRARLMELSEDTAFQGDWDSFEKEGFTILQPTYPIVVPGGESVDVVIIANAWHTDGILPVDKETTCVIEVYFGNEKMNKVEFPYLLKKKHIIDNVICWYEPISEHPDAEDPDYKE
ncbi:MAG: hypothetical protein ACFFBD_23770 [Candidatus Hodarchaeota archaeon]